MRNYLSMLLCLALLLCLPVQTAAASSATAAVSGASAGQGGIAEVSVTIADNPGLAAWTFALEWDPEALTLDESSVTAGEPFSGGTLLVNGKKAGRLYLTWFSARDVEAEGPLFSLKLAVNAGTPEGEYPIRITCSEENTLNVKEETVRVKTRPGKVTVEASAVPETPETPETPDRPADPGAPVIPGEQDRPVPMGFADVPMDSYCYDAVLWAVDRGVTSGVAPQLFAPEGVCTRAQLAVFLHRAAGSPEPMNTGVRFSDVPQGAYYEKAVLWATENGITRGTSPDTFSPDAPITRGQAVTLLWRQAGAENVQQTLPFRDVLTEMYYTQAVCWAVREGITAGTSAETFSPEAPCTRGQIVTFLFRSANGR